ncbi:MAG: D-glycero-beta-D-manno-heptose 1-phosphate adenylyltransferase [Candidatus Kapabacteria bacterium]|jgi:rfaE bifunctional protein nucleotidyltransferase chain/domain|nr:D-glycero-beta-D-manno-heptose 1-phosphate adenylyltransferase [Candidatus Kapabacteria bacterium]
MLISRDEAAETAERLRAEGKKIVFTNGCFDILHAGHVTYLAAAADLGDILFLGLNSDDSVSRLKGPERPVNNEKDRAVVLSGLRSVDYVCVFAEDSPYELIKAIQPDFLVKGGDYTPETIVGADITEARGGKVVVIALVEGKSTTAIINKMKKK